MHTELDEIQTMSRVLVWCSTNLATKAAQLGELDPRQIITSRPIGNATNPINRRMQNLIMREKVIKPPMMPSS